MAILRIESPDTHCRLAFWRIEEDFVSLRRQLHLTPDEIDLLHSFKSLQRRLEWLSVRRLVRELTHTETYIVYNERRKPFLKGYNGNISISHSHLLTGVLISPIHRVGLDLEYMAHDIGRIAHKFLNQHEYITSDKDQQLLHMYIHWCAKEALYKVCDKQDINFRLNLIIHPFDPVTSGSISGEVNTVGVNEKFDIHYFCENNYVVAYCYK